MAWICFLLCHLCLAISILAINPSQIKVFPENGAVSGVFLASLQHVHNKNHPYSFNASQAREVCLMLNVIIASKAQVEAAYRNGLETCRYGWVDEQIAVLPRITASKPCGQNRVGVIPWRSVPTKSFDAFCFNSSDVQTEVPVSTIISTTTKPTTIRTITKPTTIRTTTKPTTIRTTTKPTTIRTTRKPTTVRTTTKPTTIRTTSKPTTIRTTTKPTTIRTTTKPTTIRTTSKPTTIRTTTKPTTIRTTSKPTTIRTTSKPIPKPKVSSSPVPARPYPPTFPLPQTTQSAQSSTPPPLFPTSSNTPASSIYLLPSTSDVLLLTTSPVPPTLHPQDMSSGSPVGVVPTVLLISIASLALLATVIALWYYKMNRDRMIPFWKGGQQKDDIEEVWENLCHTEVKEQHTEMELGGIRNDSGGGL
ncbi:lymphatic vessel endothelial hyaluronic receptor 1b [Conger conger]|uniref:lymphatic vessel endothelial hyaluronic receptor 1b n=1 Tax=Conger conger TaxID=82655 RepID=UPI002A5AB0A9|nr:lymphatic vessel endothelial hyaluronic receptor 1b [Conger conger]XP_061078617.1 lymphatic vessel endothelial hyaluronic receptor 1b [Conger conger]